MKRKKLNRRASTPSERNRGFSPFQTWLKERSPLFGFCLRAAGYLGLFYLISWSALYAQAQTDAAGLTTRLAVKWIKGLGGKIEFSGTQLETSGRFLVTVAKECTGFELIALVTVVMLAFPAPWGKRGLGILLATGTLLLMNAVRVTSLFYVAAFYPGWLDTVHEDVWPILLNLVTLSILVLWTYLLRMADFGSDGLSGMVKLRSGKEA